MTREKLLPIRTAVTRTLVLKHDRSIHLANLILHMSDNNYVENFKLCEDFAVPDFPM